MEPDEGSATAERDPSPGFASRSHPLPQGERVLDRRRFHPHASIFDGETFPDFIDSLVERIEPRVNGPVVKVKYIPAGQKPENPVVSFHVDQYLLNRVSDGNNNVPHEFHRIPHFEKNVVLILEDWSCSRLPPRIQLFVMLAEIAVKRLGAGFGKQCLEHHVAAAAYREMLAIGLSQGFDARVAVLLVDAAGRIAMPTVQSFLGHVKLPGFFDKRSLPRSSRGV
jgi:hypothetical protein